MEDKTISASFHWLQSNGNPETVTEPGSAGNLVDFKSGDTAGIADYASKPITAGTNSFELWMRGRFDAPFNQVSGVRVWQSTNFSPSTGLAVFWSGTQQIYLPPAAGTSSIATSSIPTADPGTTNVSIGGSLTSCLTSSGNTDYVVLQLRTTTQAAAGDTSLMVVTMSYNEN